MRAYLGRNYIFRNLIERMYMNQATKVSNRNIWKGNVGGITKLNLLAIPGKSNIKVIKHRNELRLRFYC